VAALVILFGSGSAGAYNDYVGRTYEQAATSIKNRGKYAVIATRQGSYLPTEKCVVVGDRYQGNNVLLDLNCNDVVATPGHPGNSVASPTGSRAQLMRDRANRFSENYAKAVAAGEQPYCGKEPAWCQAVCKESDKCSPELLKFLGM
jgi:hypothetical protein